MINLCKKRFSQAEFMVDDMRKLNLNQKFDLVILRNSLFHLPPSDQIAMFQIFEKHIKPNGILVFTSSPFEGEEWGENSGEQLYHASLGEEKYHQLLQLHHFKLIPHNISDEECLKNIALVIIAKNFFK